MGRLSRVACLLTALPLLALADDGMGAARALIEQGVVLPLQEVVLRVQQQLEGRVLEAELERDDGRYVYELEWLGAKGRVWELHVDAQSGAILERKAE